MHSATIEPSSTFVPARIRTTPDWIRQVDAMSRRLDARWRLLDPASPDPDVLALQLTCIEQRLEFETALEQLAAP